ncbi:hypothetical protein BKA56DRAFT_636383 [Ilyonectria sp. MPI-CAGE-AT-0026]|nr:hypothetical protein BKA56DRAFT_636383 [Ilyonectria sp. MPI-CAGE-AT-0026]
MNTGTEGETDRSTTRLRPSCLPCQRLKKKCDRQRPRCALCTRQNRTCSYDARSIPTGDGFLTPRTEDYTSQELEPRFPPAYFLDSVLFHRSGARIKDHGSNIDVGLSSLVGNIHTDLGFVSSYFDLVHPWLPILSKKRFKERVLNPLSASQPENTLLIAATKLVAENISGGDARTLLYTSVKLTFPRLEASGILEFKVLQAWILLAVYEIGHGIYPAAYLTIGSCVRYAGALGVDTSVERITAENADDLECEEQRRSWWAILLLDRYIHLGCPERVSSYRDATNASILPFDDVLWDNGSLSDAQVHRLSSTLTMAMGRFCLTAQAAILLGKVFHNVQAPEQDEFRRQEAKILDDTIVALTQVSLEEGRFRGIGICSPTTICFSDSRPVSAGWSAPQGWECDAIASMLKLAESLASTGRCGAEELSPFCLDAMYRSGLFYAQRYSQHGDEDALKSFETIKSALEVIGRRWRTALIYLDLLNARKVTGIL